MKKSIKSTVSLILLLSLLNFAFSCKINQEFSDDLVVSSRNGNYVLSCAISGNKVYSSSDAGKAIQKGIDLLENGGSLRLSSTEYVLTQTLHLNSGIHLKGEGRKSQLIIKDADSTGCGIFATGKKDIQVSGLSIVASGSSVKAGICFDHCGDCEITDIYSEGFQEYGIWLRNNSFLCHINDCTAAGNKRANIYTDSLFWSRAGEYMPNLITNCITYGGWNGIECNKSIVLNIVGCVVHQPENFGYYIHNVSNSVLLTGCRTYQTQNDAVVVEQSHEINISSNIFCWSRGKGIVLRGVDWGTISANNIIDSGSERYGDFPGVGDAIGLELVMKTRCVQVTGNNIFNWGGQGIMKHGIFEDETCFQNSFIANNINYYESDGIISKGKGSMEKENLLHKSPALNGNPAGPDPLFKPELLQTFIRE